MRTLTTRFSERPTDAAPFWILPILAVSLLLAASSGAAPALAQEGGREDRGAAKLRFGHLSPDAPAADVYVDGRLVGGFSSVPFKTVSPYQNLPEGTREVEAYVSGQNPETSDPVLADEIDLEGGNPETLVVVGLAGDDSLEFRSYEDDHTASDPGTGRLRVIHAKPDVEAVRVNLKPDDPDTNLRFVVPGFSIATEYLEVPAGFYRPEIKVAGTREGVELEVPEVPILPGSAYTAFSVGRESDQEVVLTVDTASGGTGNPQEFLPDMPDTGGFPLDPRTLFRVLPLFLPTPPPTP